MSSIGIINRDAVGVIKANYTNYIVNNKIDYKIDSVNIDKKYLESIFSKDDMSLELTKENVLYIIKKCKIQFPEEVLKQSIHESGNFKSKLSVKGNNIFGMRKAKQRETFALKKEYCNYATYSHWIYSIADYKLWQRNKKIKYKKYSQYLTSRGYAMDKNYIVKSKIK